MTEKTCTVCGRTLPVEMFSVTHQIYRLNKCRDCHNKERREKFHSGQYHYKPSEETRKKEILKVQKQRVIRKYETGSTYRNRKEREQRNDYARKYEAEHKDDPKFQETRNRCQRNYAQRKKIREQVEMFEGFDFNDFEF